MNRLLIAAGGEVDGGGLVLEEQQARISQHQPRAKGLSPDLTNNQGVVGKREERKHRSRGRRLE